eukprot:Hpha_TRINITY_DN7511_c0_g1::TRINITY_DN7511_c0_g1_i1::g.19169::m.19169
MSRTLRTLIFMGSSRDSAPAWGGDKRLGDRILKYVTGQLKERTGVEGVRHEVTVFDPLEVFGEDGALASSGAQLRRPHFFFKAGEAPKKMDEMRDVIKKADCFLIVTAEYNHSIPPALSSMLGHFGGSNYAYKPSGIVTYSPGPWGGMRAAMALRPLLSELGCIPVSKLAGFPSVTDNFTEDGVPKDPEYRMLKQFPGLMDQLEWVALAFLKQRDVTTPP